MDTVKRPNGSHEESFTLNQVCRNLINDLESEDKENQNLKVFLRMKANENYSEDCYSIENDKIITRAPKSSNTYKSCSGGVNATKSCFTFTKIFGGESTQQEIFEDVALQPIREFLNGKNSLVFSYGTTSSGKTYTIQGNSKNIGMVPRTFDALFNSVNLVKENSCYLQPHEHCSVVQLSTAEHDNVLKSKKTLLKQAASLSEDNLATLISSSDESDIKMLLNMVTQTGRREQASSKLSLETAHVANSSYSLWVSFAEIYNENIYDLLDISNYSKVTSKNVPFKRKKLDVRMDKQGATFVKNLTQVPVFSSDEAYSLLLLGKSIQHVASTRLNQSSSRSHTVFTITAIRCTKTRDDFDPQRCLFQRSDDVRVSSLNFCDLAGSERTKKAHTETTGSRFKEATNINTSLLTLGRCIEVMRFNQLHPNKLKVVPYRESKLTRIFQTFFTGRGTARMIVNVSQDPNLFDESQQTLRFSAIAQDVNIPDQIIQSPSRRHSRYQRLGLLTPAPGERVSIDWETSTRNSTITDTSEAITGDMDKTLEETDDFSKEEYENIIRELREQIIVLKKEMLDQDWEIRQEVCQDFEKHIQELELQNEEQLREYKQEIEEQYEKRLEMYLDNYDKLKPKKRKIAVKSADRADVITETVDQETNILKKLTEDLKSSNEHNRKLEQQLAEEKETSDYLAKKNDALETELNSLQYNMKQLSDIHNESKSQSVSSPPATAADNFSESCRSDAPPTVTKKKFFDDVSCISSQSRRIEQLEKSLQDTDNLRYENQKLIEQMNSLQERLREAVKQKEISELETSQLKTELESKLGRSSIIDISFLTHEKDMEQEDTSHKVSQMELRIRELEAQLNEKSQINTELDEQVKILTGDIGRTRQISASELTSKSEEINQLQKSIWEKEKKIENLMQEKASLELEIDDFKRKLTGEEKKIAYLNKNLDCIKEKFDKCNSELSYMKTMTQHIKSEENDLRATKLGLENKLHEEQRKLEKVCDELKVKTQTISRHDKIAKDATSKLEVEKMKVRSLELKLAQAEKEVSSLKTKLSDMEQSLRTKESNENVTSYFDESNDSHLPIHNYDSFINDDDDEFREPLPPKRKMASRRTKQALDESVSEEKRVLRNTRSRCKRK